MLNLNKQQLKKLQKHLKETNSRSISAKDFNSILVESLVKKKTPSNNSLFKKASKYDYNFVFNIDKLDENNYLISLTGKHISTNTFNGYASMGRRSAYKNAIKNAAYNFSLIYRSKFKELLPLSPFEKVIIEPTAYNPKSRDDDGCSVTLKTLRDLLTTYKFIKDDNRECLTQMPVKEVISKEYKIELALRNIAA